MKERRRHKRVRRRLRVLYGERDLARVGFSYDFSESGMFVVCDGKLPIGRRLHMQVFFDQDNFVFFEGVPVREKQVPVELRSVVKGGFGVRFLAPRELLAGLFAAAPGAAPPARAPAADPAPAAGEPPPPAAPPGAPDPSPWAPASEVAADTPAAPYGAGAAAVGAAAAPPRPVSPPPGPAAPASAVRPPRRAGPPADFVVEYSSPQDLCRAHLAELRHGGVFLHADRAPARDSVVALELRLAFVDLTIAAPARVVHVVPGADGRTGLALVFLEPAAVMDQVAPHLVA